MFFQNFHRHLTEKTNLFLIFSMVQIQERKEIDKFHFLKNVQCPKAEKNQKKTLFAQREIFFLKLK
jgi:hypothetical protein